MAFIDGVEAWLDDVGVGRGAITDVRPLSGGTQNDMLAMRRGELRFVLRRAPGRDHVVVREARVLAGLADTEVPHPRLLALHHGGAAIGPATAALAWVDGVPATALSRSLSTGAEADLAGMVASTLASVHRVNVSTPPWQGVGRPEGFLERQVDRWSGQLNSYADESSYEADSLPGVEGVTLWLQQHQPPPQGAGLMHGDVHLGNVLVDHEANQATLVDWELSTVGDPLIDVGQLLVTWPDRAGRSVLGDVASTRRDPGSSEALLDCYSANSDRDLRHLRWYEVLAAFRLAVLLEGSFARHAPAGPPLHRAAISLMHAAIRRATE